MRIATLFSGIGAPEQAAKRVYGDFDTVFACEYDKFARKSYEAMYDIDPAHFHKDVRDMDATQYRGKVDILIGGSPCQSFSIAGLRGGTNDERGQLIYQYIRIVEECMPEIIIYENVKGMLSIDRGRTVKDFIQALRDIGYHCHYDVLNTKDYGVPQNRERLFIVGFLDHSTYMRFEFAEMFNTYELNKSFKSLREVFKFDDECFIKRWVNNDIGAIISTYAPAIRATQNFKTAGIRRVPNLVFGDGHERHISALEAWRLQDFQDEAFFKAKEAGLSDTQLYKHAGNSMSVNVVEMIFRQIKKAKRGERTNTLLDFAHKEIA